MGDSLFSSIGSGLKAWGDDFKAKFKPPDPSANAEAWNKAVASVANLISEAAKNAPPTSSVNLANNTVPPPSSSNINITEQRPDIIPDITFVNPNMIKDKLNQGAPGTITNPVPLIGNNAASIISDQGAGLTNSVPFTNVGGAAFLGTRGVQSLDGKAEGNTKTNSVVTSSYDPGYYTQITTSPETKPDSAKAIPGRGKSRTGKAGGG